MADVNARLAKATDGTAPQYKIDGEQAFDPVEGSDGGLHVKQLGGFEVASETDVSIMAGETYLTPFRLAKGNKLQLTIKTNSAAVTDNLSVRISHYNHTTSDSVLADVLEPQRASIGGVLFETPLYAKYYQVRIINQGNVDGTLRRVYLKETNGSISNSNPVVVIGDGAIAPNNTNFFLKKKVTRNLFDGIYKEGMLFIYAGEFYPIKNHDNYDGRVAVLPIKQNTDYSVKVHDDISMVFRVGLSKEEPEFIHTTTRQGPPLDEIVINAVASTGIREVSFNSGANNYAVVHVTNEGIERPLQVEESAFPTEYEKPYVIKPQFIDVPFDDITANQSHPKFGFYDPIPDKYHYPVVTDGAEAGSIYSLASRDIDYFYGLYDELMAQYPDYISKRLLGYGSDVEGNEDETLPIYEYAFKPPMAEAVDMPITPPVVLIESFVHGSELSSGLATYLYLKDICETYETNPVNKFMYYNIEFRVIPLANPWGFNNNKRLNAREVDVNSNFETDFAKYPKGHIYYGGDEPMSETETLVRDKWFQEFAGKAICFLDMHNFASINGEYNVGWVASYGEDVRTMMAHITNSMSRHWRSYGGKFETAPPRTVFGIVTERAAGTTRRQAYKKYGIPSVTIDQLQNLTKMEIPDAARHGKWETQISLDTIGATVIGFLKNFS